MKQYRILGILIATLFLAASSLPLPAADAPPDPSMARAWRDANAVLRRIELHVALNQYEKVLTAKADADLQIKLGPADNDLTEKQEKLWYEKQQRKWQVLEEMAVRLHLEILQRIEEDNRVAKEKEQEKAKEATRAPKP